MRVFALFLLLSGCSAQVGVVSQSIEESVSGVVYRAVEPAVPQVSVQHVVLRPPPRPASFSVAVEPVVASVVHSDPVGVAESYLGFSEKHHRAELRQFMGVDPRATEWCAAFANSVLRDSGIAGSDSVSDYPLMARSFLEWGDPVDHRQEDPRPGDIVIFPRGRASWQGHVGFFLDHIEIDGKTYWQILGGNQSNAVTVDLYVPDRALAVRRAPQPVVVADGFFDRLLRAFMQG
jgi:uncharacterized protein (TIGR02594 family)